MGGGILLLKNYIVFDTVKHIKRFIKGLKMKIPYFCCIGAELKRYEKDFDFMNQVYLYKVPTDDSIDEVLTQDYFKAISDSVLQDDIVYIYEASEKILHECRFDKKNGHITAVPLASDETITGAATSIIHDNLTPNKILISDPKGKVAAGDVSLEYIKDTLSVLHCSATLSNTIDTMTVVMLDELAAFENLDSRPSYKAAGAIVVDNEGNAGIIESIDAGNQTANVITTFVAVVHNVHNFTGATATVAGEAGLVPAPSAGDQDKILFGDGSWKKITLPANKAIISDAQGHLSTSNTTATELAFLHGVTSAVQTQINNKQDTLVSGTNIKTVNGETLLGSGNIQIESGGAMPVGAIFTTPRTGTIAGAVEANGGEYNIADYSGAGSIGALLAAGNIAYVSKTEFQTQVTNTGACDSFGWDGTSDTTFLVPKLNPWHVGKNAPVVGNGKTLGLTNGTQNAGLCVAGIAGNGVAIPYQGSFNTDVGTPKTGLGLDVDKSVGITPDPEKSGVIADLSETTNLRVMVQIATGATDQALETCTSVLSDISALKYDYVVDFQAPTAANNYMWYRKYKSGWIKQGGTEAMTGVKEKQITFPVVMRDAGYTPTVTGSWSSASGPQMEGAENRQPTGMRLTASYQGVTLFWTVEGLAA